MQLARAVRNRTTGVLYVLDEPSIGLHPSNLVGLTAVVRDLIADGNSVVLVDHDTQILSEADWIIEMGPGAGADGGRVIAEGTPGELGKNPASRIGAFLSGSASIVRKKPVPAGISGSRKHVISEDNPEPEDSQKKSETERGADFGENSSFHGAHSYGEASGSGHPQREADGSYRSVRFREDDADSGKSGAGGLARPFTGKVCRSMYGLWTRPESGR